MILFLILLALSLLSLAFFLYSIIKKRFYSPLWTCVGLFYSAVMLIFPLVSVIYHQVGNQARLEQVTSLRNELMERQEAYLETHEGDMTLLKQALTYFNENLEQGKNRRENPFLSYFAYPYCESEFEALYIDIKL